MNMEDKIPFPINKVRLHLGSYLIQAFKDF